MASALNDKAVKPTEEMLAEVLAGSKAEWDDINSYIASTYKKPSEEWKFYGAN